MPKFRSIYSIFISLLGILLVVWGIIQIPSYTPLFTFILFLILAGTAKSTMTHLIQGSAIVSVNSAISLATVPLYGPVAGALVAAVAEFGLWLISIRVDQPPWKQAAERLGVNVGMNSVAIFLAGLFFQSLTTAFGENTVVGQTIPWVLAALIADQVNLWLLAFIVYLAHGVSPLEVWQGNRWVIPINVMTMSIGGGLLHVTVSQFDFLGIAIFFLPIILSAYSYRVITNNAKQQMEKLEELVELRTHALADAKGELELLHQEKDTFIGVLTHDMRTPLTSIKGYGSLLRDHELPREQQVHIINVILRNQNTLLEIVDNILEIQKMESGTPILLERSQFDLVELTEMVVESIQTQAQEKQIQLDYEASERPITITADQKKIERVLMNLISNAVKYTPKEGAVSVLTEKNGQYLFARIEDNGYGIPEEQLPYIFERFRRVPGHRRKASGTGLGLAIVKSLVEAHGGNILVHSEEGVGSTFTVMLPIQPTEDLPSSPAAFSNGTH